MAMKTRCVPGAMAVALLGSVAARAQEGAPQLPRVEVVSISPLPGLGVPRDQVPANVQTTKAAQIERRGASDLAEHLNRSLVGVDINAMQGNAFQPDLQFRGYSASPLLGTPQGLSVYLDGVRMNQPFGDVVSWDLIPRAAIASATLMPGSNPLFGLNTLGGALAVQVKTGVSHPGTSTQLTLGQHRRRALEFETGGSNDAGRDWFVTGHRLHEQGWRSASPSDLSQLFGRWGMRDGGSDMALTAALADNRLTGNGLQEAGALQRDAASVYTTPDTTRNRSMLLKLALGHDLGERVTVSGHVYYRQLRTRTLNGDLNDDSLTADVYQPTAGEQAALTQAGYSGFPTSGESAANTPFPKWRCIANAWLNDEPNEVCTGLLNRTATRQHNLGAAGQISWQLHTAGLSHQLLAGVALDANRVQFSQSTQFGYVNADRSVTPVDGPGAFADGSQASDEAYDARVELASRARTWSAYASDTVALGAGVHLTLAGRYNRNAVRMADGLTPGGGPGSLDGVHRFERFNPGVGITFAPSATVNGYVGVNQGSRSPTAVELGCADPASPCKLPNAFAGDPPLKQVVTTTAEAGVRGGVVGRYAWSVGLFRADNRDDLLFVSDSASGYGYFRNFGKTRRQGLEASVSARAAVGLQFGAQVSLLDARYRSTERIDGSSNSSNDAAQAGFPGTQGTIEINPGDRIPLLPRRVLKLYADWDVNERWSLGADMRASSGANARGNENGQHQPDGVVYSGAGRSAGYAVFNTNLEVRPAAGVKLVLQVDNVFNRRYSTAAQLGANGFDANGHYASRSLPADGNGDWPVPRATFFAPGAPRSVWIGLRWSYL